MQRKVMFSFIGNSTLRSFYASGTPTAWPSLNPYRITPIHWLMAQRHLWRNDVVRSYWRTRHPLLRFLCRHEAVTLPFVVHPHLFSVWQLGDALSFPRYSPSFRRQRAACVGTQSILPCSFRTCRGFTATGRGQTAKAYLLASSLYTFCACFTKCCG